MSALTKALRLLGRPSSAPRRRGEDRRSHRVAADHTDRSGGFEDRGSGSYDVIDDDARATRELLAAQRRRSEGASQILRAPGCVETGLIGDPPGDTQDVAAAARRACSRRNERRERGVTPTPASGRRTRDGDEQHANLTRLTRSRIDRSLCGAPQDGSQQPTQRLSQVASILILVGNEQPTQFAVIGTTGPRRGKPGRARPR